MRFDIVTIFPEMFAALTQWGITGRACEQGLVQVKTWNPRDFTADLRRTVDDRAYGGGPGMVMMAKPLEDTLAAVAQENPGPVILLSLILIFVDFGLLVWVIRSSKWKEWRTLSRIVALS